jgi:hypothetical protein
VRRFLVAAVGVVLGLTACGSAAPDDGHSARRSATASTGSWRQAGESRTGGSLHGVAATGPYDAWAVGGQDEGDAAVMRWSGGGWRSVNVPGAGSLDAVTAPARNEVWVFGKALDDSRTGESRPTEGRAWRWNGRAWTLAWRETGALVETVTAAGPDDVWVAGHTGTCFLKHWSGTRWSTVPLPPGVCVRRMSALSPRDVWAVGDAHDRPAVLHWDGRTWNAVPLPPGIAQQSGTLSGVAAASQGQAWAVGANGTEHETQKKRRPIALRWDGRRWAVIPLDGITTAFGKVAADGHGGILVSPIAGGPSAIFHYDGREWTRELIPPAWVDDIVLIPGTSQAIAVGGCCLGWDEDTMGRIWMRR